MSSSDSLLQRLKKHVPGTALTREFYTDESIYALDLERVFYKDWLFAGHTCELPKTGSYFTLQIGDYPIVIVRGGDRKIRAFVNSCRHRGARVCQQAHGQTPKMVCPYHQWTYDLDGRLFAARQMGSDFDRSKFGLRPVHCESVAGYIFVCVAQDAPDFGPTREHLEPYLAPHRIDEARVAFESTILEEGNWKLVWENNRECYHCSANHPELARTYADTPAITGVSGVGEDPAVAAHWQRCESQGLASRFKIAPDGTMRTTRIPLLKDAVSYTMSGQPAVKKPLSDRLSFLSGAGALLLFHYPTTWNHLLVDHAISFRILPLAPTRTQLVTKWLVHRNAVEGVDYDLKDLTHVWLETNEQDQHIVAENQIGVSTPTYTPGPYSIAQEGGVSQFVEWYVDRMRCRLTDSPLSDVA
jgi:glycine betaine catabolism A